VPQKFLVQSPLATFSSTGGRLKSVKSKNIQLGLAPPEEIIKHEPYIGVIVFAENPITTIFYTHAKISTVKFGY